MIKRIVPFALLGAAIFGFTACNSKGGGMKKTKDGLEYKIVKDAPGDKKVNYGDIVEMHVVVKVGDSTLFNSRTANDNKPVELPLTPPAFKGDWPEGMTYMTAGDSAIFYVSIDSVKKSSPQPLPEFMKEGGKITYEVTLVSVKTQDEAKAAELQEASEQVGIDDKKLQEYFAQNNINAQKTESGLYYVIEKEGSGPTASAGQDVTVNYTGKTMDGKTFDSNVDPQFQHVEPFTFKLGQGQVIRGWDEGVALLKKGSKAKLYIPSPLAYGTQDRSPSIPPNSVLIFDVEVTDIK